MVRDRSRLLAKAHDPPQAGRPAHPGKGLGRIQAPVRVIFADRDRYFPLPAGRRLAEALPNAELKVIPECGHFLQEEKPDAFNKLVLEFLQARGTATLSPDLFLSPEEEPRMNTDRHG